MSTFEETLKPYVDPRWSFGMTVGCPEGWQQLVLDAHAKLVTVDPDYKIMQIKEKFGGLRYYVATTDYEAAEEIIRPAEIASLETCEKCGTKESVTTATLGEGFYWILTLCDPCRATRLAERKAYDAELKAKYGDDEDDEEDE